MEAMASHSQPLRHGVAEERKFFAWLAIGILCAAILGFARTYILIPFIGVPDGALPPTPLVHVHAAIFSLWCVLVAFQSFLVVRGRVAAHRSFGLFGFLLYLGLVVTGPLVALNSVIRYGSPVDELAFLSVSLGNVLAYTLVLGAAFYWRRNPPIHKRLIVLGMVVLLTAPFGRLMDLPYQLPHVLGPGLVVVALAVWDRHARGATHATTRYVGSAILLWELVPNLYMNSDWWLTFARWVVGVAD